MILISYFSPERVCNECLFYTRSQQCAVLTSKQEALGGRPQFVFPISDTTDDSSLAYGDVKQLMFHLRAALFETLDMPLSVWMASAH